MLEIILDPHNTYIVETNYSNYINLSYNFIQADIFMNLILCFKDTVVYFWKANTLSLKN